MSELEKLKNLDDDYTRKKASFDNLPTFKRDMKERYDQVLLFPLGIILRVLGRTWF